MNLALGQVLPCTDTPMAADRAETDAVSIGGKGDDAGCGRTGPRGDRTSSERLPVAPATCCMNISVNNELHVLSSYKKNLKRILVDISVNNELLHEYFRLWGLLESMHLINLSIYGGGRPNYLDTGKFRTIL